MADPSDRTENLACEIEAAVDAWFVESFHNSPVSRATEIFNHVRAAVDALQERLGAILKER
ncbi:hypothetical protein [Rhodoblastus sp.]|uniref:hypothetical protein n=1 Tax=Rhodoblastus sp. TaxID=1962975 RepID=UPI00262224E5|nr:hypothetical protein [Rhodoblastus sp.]